MKKNVMRSLQQRDTLLKKARVSALPVDWYIYKLARKKASNAIIIATRNFYINCFEENKGNSKGIWKTIKSLTGTNRNATETKSALSVSADEFNQDFSTIADKLCCLLPSMPFTNKLVVSCQKMEDLSYKLITDR